MKDHLCKTSCDRQAVTAQLSLSDRQIAIERHGYKYQWRRFGNSKPCFTSGAQGAVEVFFPEALLCHQIVGPRKHTSLSTQRIPAARGRENRLWPTMFGHVPAHGAWAPCSGTVLGRRAQSHALLISSVPQNNSWKNLLLRNL